MRTIPSGVHLALTRLFEDLAPTGAVTLKNADLFSNFARGGDWDVLVRDLADAERKLVERLGLPDRVAYRSYVHGYFYPWGEIDLLPDWTWRGARLMDRSALFGAAEHREGGVFPVVDLAHEATIAWFSSILWGRAFNQRYGRIVEQAVAECPGQFQAVLGQVFGTQWRHRLWGLAIEGRPADAISSVDALRRSVLLRALRRDPVGTAARWIRLWLAEISLRRHPVVPWLWARERDVDDLAATLRVIASEEGTAVSGVRIYRWPGGVNAGLRPDSLLRALRQYWGSLVTHRARGVLIVFVPPVDWCSSVSRAYSWMCAVADLDLTAHQAKTEELRLWLRSTMQARTAALLKAQT